MALCMQPRPPTLQDELVNGAERAVPKKTLQASEPGRLMHLLCPPLLPLLPAKTQVGPYFHRLQCLSLYMGSSMLWLCRGRPNLSRRPTESRRSLSRGGRGQLTILSNLCER